MEETRERFGELEKKSGLSRTEIESVMDALLARIRIIPADDVASKRGVRLETFLPSVISFISTRLRVINSLVSSELRHSGRGTGLVNH